MERVLRIGLNYNSFITNSVFVILEKLFVVFSPFEWSIVFQEIIERVWVYM